MKTSFVTLILALAAFASPSPAFGCSVCGCSLSSDWAAQGYTMAPGFDAGLRFEYFEQSDLRSGTGGVDRTALTFPNDNEIQQRTVNRNTWLDLNYGINATWAVSASLPYDSRFHTTIAAGDTGISTSEANGFGDLRVLARFQKFIVGRSFAVQFGLKLPTGRFDQNFFAGPQTGQLLDRGLQLGTGTTDLIAGVSWFGRPATAVGCFVQATVDQPLAARDGFLPSSSLNVSGGLRWLNTSRFTPQLQLNFTAESREHGVEADTPNSGSEVAYVSPGLTAQLSARASAFAFVQLPVYRRVNGLQLEPRWVLSTGIRWHW